MKRFHPHISKESWESQRKAGRYNPALTACFAGVEVLLPAGTSDTMTFWRDRTRVLLLTTNSRLGYAGLTEFDALDGSESGSVFVQDMYGGDAPPDFFDRAPHTQRNYLLEML